MKNKIYWPDNTIYFLTGSTFLHYPYFRENEQKQIVLDQIKKIKERLNIPISAYSISINHYHLKFYLESGVLLSKIKQILHGGTTFEYKKRYKIKYKDLWQTSRVIRVLSEEVDWKVTGYIIGNLLKHKELNTFEELINNHFSSYWLTAKKYGEEFARQLVYSVIEVDENSDGIVNIKEMKKLKFLDPRLKPGRR